MQQQVEGALEHPLDSGSDLLSERALTAVRSAFQGQLRHPSSDLATRRALRALCLEARTRELRAEQLIVLFKRIWHSLPESRGRDTHKKQQMLDRMITICVEEYYAT